MLSLIYLQKNEVYKWSFSLTKFGYDLEFQILDDNMVGWNLMVDETKNDNHFCISETFDTFMSYSDAILTGHWNRPVWFCLEPPVWLHDYILYIVLMACCYPPQQTGGRASV